MEKFLAKATMLAKMAAVRLNKPMVTTEKKDVKSLEASIRAAAMLHKMVPILQIAQVLHYKSPIPSRGKLLGGQGDGHSQPSVDSAAKKPMERIHNLHEQEWRILKPGMERETKHLRWRK
ncbi:hypothetical protein BgAZ_205650 [Babesia gibsoni]|uniref:Uncharacterized protein n=1 Tax=Babesia gibsoni TaxID=33632 RepID=A0AAD8PE04_BABGI|nr:hypothetical protein BgAZ_205650 [Babesia gibsoni]